MRCSKLERIFRQMLRLIRYHNLVTRSEYTTEPKRCENRVARYLLAEYN